MAAPDDLSSALSDKSLLIELTYHWDARSDDIDDNFGHLAFAINDIFECCSKLESTDIEILRPPRDGNMAFIKLSESLASIVDDYRVSTWRMNDRLHYSKGQY